MYAALMFTSKKLMEFLPNVHLLGTLIMVATIAWRGKALIPIYVYVFLEEGHEVGEGELLAKIKRLYRGTRLDEVLKEWKTLRGAKGQSLLIQ